LRDLLLARAEDEVAALARENAGMCVGGSVLDGLGERQFAGSSAVFFQEKRQLNTILNSQSDFLSLIVACI
jgi:hypothetical protein